MACGQGGQISAKSGALALGCTLGHSISLVVTLPTGHRHAAFVDVDAGKMGLDFGNEERAGGSRREGLSERLPKIPVREEGKLPAGDFRWK
eukprot:10026305-Alexandrium_andersonii.AAC.1